MKLEEKEVKINEEEVLEEVREQNKKIVTEDAQLTPEQEETIKKILAEAKMPVELTDEEFKLGDNELDIRALNDKNFKQMLFRGLALNSVYQKQIVTSLVDITKLLFIVLEKLGVDDVIKATDDLAEKLQKQALEKQVKRN